LIERWVDWLMWLKVLKIQFTLLQEKCIQK
jgi:hypothetical protein